MQFQIPRLLPIIAAIVFAAGGFGNSAHSASTWPGLRGPSYDGAAHDGKLFDGGTGELSIGWKRDLGSGYPVVAVDAARAVTMFASGNDDVAAAFDTETGDELWRYRINETYKGHTGSHDGPIATPALVEGRVFGLGPRGDLFALDAASGKELWVINLVDDLGSETPFYGFSTSPVMADGVLVVEVGAGAGKTVAGFNPDNGKQLWAVGDDKIAYHSPIVTSFGGRQQVVAVGQKMVMGIEATTGKTLWSHEHNGDERAMGGETVVPIPAGEDRLLLLNTHPASVMLRISSKDGADYEIAELWSGGSIRSTYVLPVYFEGHLYGMTGKIFTCVDAETGETNWKAREPGDGFPTLVGNQLVIMSKPGTLIVANASPAGYDEVTRLELFDEHSWSAPAFANGHLYLRSMAQIARVDLEGKQLATGQAADSWISATAFGAFLQEVGSASDKGSVIDAFLEKQTSFPIVEDSGAVHFVYRGKSTDVGIVGDMIGFRREEPMIRVADTDLLYYSIRLEPEASINYGFIVDYGDPTPDPRNPRPGSGLFGEVSWFAMPAWQSPDHLGEADVAHQGRLESIEWESKVREGQTRPAKVYLPSGYDSSSGRRYPVLYFFRGEEVLGQGSFKNTLDNLIGKTVEPLIAVMVVSIGENPREDIGEDDSFVEMISTELVPMIDNGYRTIQRPEARAVAGTGSAADTALAAAFQHPELYGRIGAIWPVLFGYDSSLISNADEMPMVIYQGWGTYHIRSPHEAWDQVVANRELQETLREAGYRPAGGEVPEGVGWSIYRGRTDDMLTALFPQR